MVYACSTLHLNIKIAVGFIPETARANDVIYRTDNFRRVAVSDHSGRDIFGHHASRTYNCVFPDDNAGKYTDVDAYLRPFFNSGATHAFQGIGASRMDIISQSCTRGEEDIVFNEGELGNINFIVNFDVITYLTTVVDSRVVPDTEMVSDGIFLSYHHVVAGLKIAANTATTIDNGAGANVSPRSNSEKTILRSTCQISNNYAIVNSRPALY
jgi:hypothetical protein